MASGQLPQEIYDDILYHLQRHPSALRATALTHHSLLGTSQKHLFAQIALYPPSVPGHRSTAARLHRLLADAPHLGRYVTHLDLHLCADHSQWKGWAALELCLPLLMQLRVLGVHVDQPSGWGSGFTKRASVSAADGRRVVDALVKTLELPSLVYLDTYCVDMGLLLSHCRHIRELRLSAPIAPAHDGNEGRELRGLACGEGLIVLEGLRIEKAFELQDYYPGMYKLALHAQGITLRGLRRLSMMYHGRHEERCIVELRSILEECNGTLEELEVDIRLTADDLDALGQHNSTTLLPSLRVMHLHLHLHPHTLSAPGTPADLRTLVRALTAFLRQLSAPSPSALSRLALTNHGEGDAAADAGGEWQTMLRDVLCDAGRFPALRVLSWQGACEVVERLRAGALAGVGVGLPFKVRLGVGECLILKEYVPRAWNG